MNAIGLEDSQEMAIIAIFTIKPKSMKHCIFILILGIAYSCAPNDKKSAHKTPPSPGKITLVIHGGAGTITRQNLSPEREKVYHEKLKEALDSGYAVLERGGTSVNAVVAAIKIMEDSPLFNAGKGAVFTSEGKNELDASIMDGATLMAGAVAGVTTIKNPITAAHAVMTKSSHVMLTGAGAEKFAEEQGLTIVPPSYFIDSMRYQQWKKVKEKESGKQTGAIPFGNDHKFGTVGCVALDQHGNLAAGTSTGGMTNKKYGRVGDSPIIGGGTYANNATCGVSATGWGEYFIRLSIAHDISALIEYTGASLPEATDRVIMKKLTDLGGDGGVIALNRQGEISMEFNTAGMYRGYKRKGEEAKTFIYKDE